jgi:hypothetical protein
MEMIFIDFKAGRPFVVKRAAGKTAAVHIEPVVAYKLPKVYPVLNVLKYV